MSMLLRRFKGAPPRDAPPCPGDLNETPPPTDDEDPFSKEAPPPCPKLGVKVVLDLDDSLLLLLWRRECFPDEPALSKAVEERLIDEPVVAHSSVSRGIFC